MSDANLANEQLNDIEQILTDAFNESECDEFTIFEVVGRIREKINNPKFAIDVYDPDDEDHVFVEDEDDNDEEFNDDDNTEEPVDDK